MILERARRGRVSACPVLLCFSGTTAERLIALTANLLHMPQRLGVSHAVLMDNREMMFRYAFACATLSLPLAAADLTGHWTFDGDVNGNAIRLACDLKQEGLKLEGVCKSAASEFKLAGEVNDPKVRFSYAVDYQGSTYTLYYSGTLESEVAMKGEIGVSGTTGTFSAKKS